MPDSVTQYRFSTGLHYNKMQQKQQKDNTQITREFNRNISKLPEEIKNFAQQVIQAENSTTLPARQLSKGTPVRQNAVSAALQVMLLFSQVKAAESAFFSAGYPRFSQTTNALFYPRSGSQVTENRDVPLVMMNPGGSQSAPAHTVLLPSAWAAPVTSTDAAVVKDVRSGAYIITDEQKKNELISSVAQYLISAGLLDESERHDYEFRLRTEAGGMPLIAARLDDKENTGSRKKRALAAQYNPQTAQHIKENCAYGEEEILNPAGQKAGKLLLFQAQRAENPFRMLYDGTDGRPSPEERGIADGLNIAAQILTLGILPSIGSLIASAKRSEYYQSIGDEICSLRYKKIFVAELSTLADADSLPFTMSGASKKLKRGELAKALPMEQRAAYFTMNPQTRIRKEILFELQDGTRAINDGRRSIFVKPTEKPDEFKTYYPHAVDSSKLERRVIVDETKGTWRYADKFDSSKLNVVSTSGKAQIELFGDYYELHQNKLKKYEIVVHKESGIKEYIPVYMEPLSKTWHLSVHNQRPVFDKKQSELITALKVSPEEGFCYNPSGNNNKNYYGNANIYVQEKIGDESHYYWGRYIEMNGEMVPVRNTQHKGQGVLYEVYDIKNPDLQGHSVEWDGHRWLFEKPTSAHLSDEVSSFLSNDNSVQILGLNDLSAPDQRGLRWSTEGDSYIKINDKYYQISVNGDDGILHINKKDDLGIKLSFRENKFGSDELIKISASSGSLNSLGSSHAFSLSTSTKSKSVPSRGLGKRINPRLIAKDLNMDALSSPDSLGIRTDSSGKQYINLKDGWVNIAKNNVGYYIPDGQQIIRIQHSGKKWRKAPLAPGFPGQLEYYPKESAKAKIYCDDGYSTTIDIDSSKTLTENILQHFDAIDDGIVLDITKLKSEKHNLFSINKITLDKSGVEKSVFYPDDKPGGFKNYKVLFDSVPLNNQGTKRALVTPDNYKAEGKYAHYPYDFHVMKQGNLDSCGYTCAAMLAQDLKNIKGISADAIDLFTRLKSESSGGIFSTKLSEELNRAGVQNVHLNNVNPAKYVQDKMQDGMWSGIVNINGHFCIINKVDSSDFFLRDPYQGTLFVDKIKHLKQYEIGKDIIELI